MPHDVCKGEVIETTVGVVGAELARRGLDPDNSVTIMIERDELISGRRVTGPRQRPISPMTISTV